MAKIKISDRPQYSQNLIKRREDLGLSQMDLADKAGVHINVIKRMESGRNRGRHVSRESIAQALNCSISSIFGRFEDLPKDPEEKQEAIKDLLGDSFSNAIIILKRMSNITPSRRAVVLAFLFDELAFLAEFAQDPEVASMLSQFVEQKPA